MALQHPEQRRLPPITQRRHGADLGGEIPAGGLGGGIFLGRGSDRVSSRAAPVLMDGLEQPKSSFIFFLFAEVCKIPASCPAPCCIQNIFIRFSLAISSWVSPVPEASHSSVQGCLEGGVYCSRFCSQNLGRENQTAACEGHTPSVHHPPHNARILTRLG